MFSADALNACRPGYLLNNYPENRRPQGSAIKRAARNVTKRLRGKRLARAGRRLGQATYALAEQYAELDAAQWQAELLEVRGTLARRGWSTSTLRRALAIAGAQVRHTHGFAPHPTQYMAALVMLRGQLAEMATGEGKTIVAGLTAVVAGISGLPVHVVTSNDYLVERDAQSMRALFDAFGLTSGFVCQDSHDDARRSAYASDICYVSNKQLVFDYLRDRQTCGTQPSSIAARIGALSGRSNQPPLLRGLCFAIVDEADSALIDDAITPLILSHQIEGQNDMAQAVTALSLARRLKADEHFTTHRQNRRATLTSEGEQHLAEIAEGLHPKWRNRRFRNELTQQALAATHIFRRDVDYLVQDGEVHLIDQATGRRMPDRKLQNGLHQMIEAKERCELSGATRTIASLSFQNFFPRYKHLCGMTGTAQEAARELARTYQLGVVRVPTHRPSQRRDCGAFFARSEQSYRDRLLTSITERRRAGQPVLIGTRSLAHSEHIADMLKEAGIPHSVLNARQDAEESEVISKAGAPATVTIATNMAGRGTDIPVSRPVREIGGLHVIVSQLNESRRVDRQLIGRCARQGDAGSFEYIIAPDDPVLGDPPAGRILSALRRPGMPLARRAQQRLEKRQRWVRAQVASSDRHMRKKLSYTGYKE
jgi:preprotein translocase subunit SecA